MNNNQTNKQWFLQQTYTTPVFFFPFIQMMSLNTLGRELEGGYYYNSIAFLVYNIALVVFTTMVMMGMVYARIRWIQYKIDSGSASSNNNSLTTTSQQLQDQQQRLRDTSSVGFSAVLFAWMVISTMERKQATCPVPFFNDVCFSTYEVPGLPWLKFNVAPIVSLFVAQFIMPRVSFMGHLAGIVCGFCLHWGVFIPPLEICSPNVLIGGVLLIGLIWRRRIIPVRPLLRNMLDEEACVEHEEYLRSLLLQEDELMQSNGSGGDPGNASQQSLSSHTDPFMRSKQKKKERELNEARRKQKTMLLIQGLLGVVSLTSLFIFGWNSSLFLSQCLILAYFTFGKQSTTLVKAYTRSKVESDIIDPEKQRSGRIYKGLIISAVLSIVVDSMSVASWFIMSTFSAERLSLSGATAFMLFRITVNLTAMLISTKVLHDLGEVGSGAFVAVFGKVIQWSKLSGDGLFVALLPKWTAFEGRGIQLGGRTV